MTAVYPEHTLSRFDEAKQLFESTAPDGSTVAGVAFIATLNNTYWSVNYDSPEASPLKLFDWYSKFRLATPPGFALLEVHIINIFIPKEKNGPLMPVSRFQARYRVL